VAFIDLDGQSLPIVDSGWSAIMLWLTEAVTLD
jgi:hypothetical protein